MNLIKSLLEQLMVAVAAAAVCVAFWYFGHFAVPASILLGICFTVIAVWLYGLWKFAAFEPYRITIYVNFDVLRDDLGLLKTDKPPDQDEPAYELYIFTAISATVFAHYRSYVAKTAMELLLTDRMARSDEEFHSMIAFGAQIPCALKPVQFDNGENRDPHPTFFFRPARDGYQFGIRVVPEWWAQHTKQSNIQMRDLAVSHNDEIVLAFLPYGYVPDHLRRWDKPVSLLYPFDFKQRRWKSRLMKHGWSVEDNSPACINHRFLCITFYTI